MYQVLEYLNLTTYSFNRHRKSSLQPDVQQEQQRDDLNPRVFIEPNHRLEIPSRRKYLWRELPIKQRDTRIWSSSSKRSWLNPTKMYPLMYETFFQQGSRILLDPEELHGELCQQSSKIRSTNNTLLNALNTKQRLRKNFQDSVKTSSRMSTISPSKRLQLLRARPSI